MLKTLLTLALMGAALPASAQPADTGEEAALPPLNLQQQASLRCGVTFGLVAGGQERGEENALAYPPMEPRGREFFIRTTAQLMDEAGLTREQVQAMVMIQLEALDAMGENAVAETMPACLSLLDASGL